MFTSVFLVAAFNLLSARVEIPHNAEPSTLLSVTELTNYVARATEVALEVEIGGRGRQRKTPSVIIGTLGTLKDVPERVRTTLNARKEPEAFWIGTDGGSLWIVGKNDTGELRGTYRFLETKLGVRWFKIATADDPGDYVPTAKTIVIDDFAECRAPRFAIRRLDQTGSWGSHIPRQAMTLANRLGFQTYPSYGGRVPFEKPESEFGAFFGPRVMRQLQDHGGGHCTISDAIPPKTYFDTHPEYFALVDGKRQKDHFYCLTNPDVAALTASNIIRRFRCDGGRGQYHFGQTDSVHGFCKCERCLAAAGKDAKADDISRSFGLFVKDVAARVWTECPEADLSLWAYSTYRRYTGTEQDPRMKIWYTTHGRCHAHALDDPACLDNTAILKEIEQWHTPDREIYFYDYLTCAPNLYTCNEAVEAHDIRLYDRMGYIGWKNEAPFSDAKYDAKNERHPEVFPSNWQWLYVAGHLLWDPKEGWEALLADAESKYYGPAYPAMREYQAERRRLWAKPGPCMGYPRGDSRRPLLLSEPGSKEKLLALLDKAEKLAAGDALRLRRVRQDRTWLEKYWIKPNERIREEEKRAIRLAETKGLKIDIDGCGDEDVWKDAPRQTEFRSTTHGEDKPGRLIPKGLETEVKVLRDAENLYFLCTAMEPKAETLKFSEKHDGPVWEENHFEFMFAPPVIDCRYYQVAVNAKGTVFDASWPGCKTADDFGVEAKGRVEKDRYVIEMRVPVEKMHEFVPGEKWRVLFGRCRFVKDELTPNHWEWVYSVGGCGFHDTSRFIPVEIK